MTQQDKAHKVRRRGGAIKVQLMLSLVLAVATSPEMDNFNNIHANTSCNSNRYLLPGFGETYWYMIAYVW